MPAKPILLVVAVLVVGALVLTTAIRGEAPVTAAEWLSPIGPAVALAGAVLWLWDRFIWHWPGVRKLVGRPVLRGTWHGEFASDWINPETRQPIAPDPDAFLVIRQRFWHASARLLTKESESFSTLASLRATGDGVHQLLYLYTNTPRAEARYRSEPHYGAVILGAPHDRAQGMEGHYFTDRGTRGALRFRRHHKKLAETYAGARALFSS